MRKQLKEESWHPAKRVWEIDALRGFLILLVLGYHLYMTVNAFCINGIYNIDSVKYVSISDPLGFWFSIDGAGNISYAPFPRFSVEVLQPICVDIFFVVSGVSCIFSRNNLYRGLKILAGAFIFSGFTMLLAMWSGNPVQFIRFGVLHCYAYCHLIFYFILENKQDRTLLLVCVPIFLVGYYLKYNPVYLDTFLLLPFGVYENGNHATDYWPIFPMLGWMLLGVVIGRRLYKEKKSLLPNRFLMNITRPLQWMGRFSGQIYLLHIFVYTVLFYGIGFIFEFL